MKLLIVALALALPTVAHADEASKDRYISTSVIAGADRDLYGGLAAEAGARIDTYVFVRGMVHAGSVITLNDVEADYVQGRVGVELRNCVARGLACGSIGVDLGLHQRETTEGFMTERRENLVVAPRVGFDVGGALRLRGSIELVQHVGERSSATGAAATLGVGFAF
jgi:small basic protein